MSGRSAELYDYEWVRRLPRAAVLSPAVTATLIVLGSRQSDAIVRDPQAPTRRRRGGGGAVLLHADDLWLDFWIPRPDGRHRDDVRVAAALVGSWWRDALGHRLRAHFVVHEGPGAPSVACFGATGDGEVERSLEDGSTRKVVGLTQWRVREGSLVSTVLHARSTHALASRVAGAVEFEHDSLASLGLTSVVASVRDDVLSRGGPWDVVAAPPVP